MRTTILAIGCVLILVSALALPYVFYISYYYGVSDPRIEWAPLGMASTLIGLVLLHFAGREDI